MIRNTLNTLCIFKSDNEHIQKYYIVGCNNNLERKCCKKAKIYLFMECTLYSVQYAVCTFVHALIYSQSCIQEITLYVTLTYEAFHLTLNVRMLI